MTLRFRVLLMLPFAILGWLAAPAESFWTQAQMDAAATSGTTPLLWAEARIYGGLDAQNYPLAPVAWAELKTYASLPAQEFIQAEAQPTSQTQVLELHRPDAIASRFLYDYDAYLSNVIYVENHSEKWNNRFFDFHFLEDVFIPYSTHTTFRNGRRINDNLFLWSRPAHYEPGLSRDEFLFYMIQSNPIDFECAGHVWVDGNQMLWECAVINHSPYEWSPKDFYTATGGLLCFRTRNNPDFYDPLGQRVYYHDLNRRRLATNVYDLDGCVNQYYGHSTLAPPYSNMLTKFSQGGDLFLTAESTPNYSVGGNREAIISCIHANVGWMVPVGGFQKINATVTFHELSAAGSWALYK